VFPIAQSFGPVDAGIAPGSAVAQRLSVAVRRRVRVVVFRVVVCRVVVFRAVVCRVLQS
jgi:hypothetical protein